MLGRLNKLVTRLLAVPPPVLARRQPKLTIYRPRTIEHPENMYFGSRTSVREHAWLSTIPEYAGRHYQPRLEIGNDVYIGRYACITCIDRVSVGDECVLSEHVYIADSAHGHDPQGPLIMQQDLASRGPVIIGKRSFIGYRACILSGVSLGQHCIVGANSVVTKSFPDYSMIGGVPARLLKRYDAATRQWIAVS